MTSILWKVTTGTVSFGDRTELEPDESASDKKPARACEQFSGDHVFGHLEASEQTIKGVQFLESALAKMGEKSKRSKDEQIAMATSLLNELTFWETTTVAIVTPKARQTLAETKKTPKKSSVPSHTTWKSAVDPSSGRTYYYDTVTRKTQWEKPRELKQIEKRKKQEQKEKDSAFFREMEQNLLQSLGRGELVPGWKPETPVEAKSASVSKRVRTISGLNEQWMVELQSKDRPVLKPVGKGPRTQSPTPKRGLPPLKPPTPKREASSDEDDDLRGVDFLRENAASGAKATITPTVPTHVRRNTMDGDVSTTTMEQPDIPATIQTVSGVLRAHIVDAARNPPRPSIFSDGGSNKVPTLAEIQEFVWEFYHRSQMEFDAIIMSLIYVERLMKETEGALMPSPDNWSSVIFSCMVLASKVWDDLSMWNIDFSNVSKSCLLASFSLQRINELERAVLQCLNFAVVIPASEYAKYYYLLRSMMIRGGLGVPRAPNQADKLQDRTFRYQNKVQSQQRRARSVDWGEPLLRETVCLEQIVSR